MKDNDKEKLYKNSDRIIIKCQQCELEHATHDNKIKCIKCGVITYDREKK